MRGRGSDSVEFAIVLLSNGQLIGFKLVGRLRGQIVMNGKRYDQVIMDLLREELTLHHTARFATLDELPAESARSAEAEDAGRVMSNRARNPGLSP